MPGERPKHPPVKRGAEDGDDVWEIVFSLLERKKTEHQSLRRSSMQATEVISKFQRRLDEAEKELATAYDEIGSQALYRRSRRDGL